MEKRKNDEEAMAHESAAESQKQKRALEITELYVFIMTDEDGREHAIATNQGSTGILPLIGYDMERVKSLAPEARDVIRMSGCKVRLKKFKFVEEIDF